MVMRPIEMDKDILLVIVNNGLVFFVLNYLV